MKYLFLVCSFLLFSGCKVERVPDKFEKVKINYTQNKPYGKNKKFKVRYTIVSTNEVKTASGKYCRKMKNIRTRSYYIANVSKSGCAFIESLK